MVSRRSWFYDAIVALVVTGIAVGGSIGEANPHQEGARLDHIIGSHSPGGFYAVVAMGGLVLAFRRRWPLVTLAASAAADAAYGGAGFVDGAAFVPVLVALYTVGTIKQWKTTVASAMAALSATWLAAALGNSTFGWIGAVNSVRWACVIAAVAFGLLIGNRQQLITLKWEEEARRRVDAERLRIARELHDVVAHSMSMINVQAGVAAHVLNTEPEQAASALKAIREASHEGLRELRSILNVLRQADEADGRQPAPGLAALGSLAAAAQQAGIVVEVSTTGERGALPPSVDLAAYRIVQESLTNVLRHSAAERARIELRYEPSHVVVSVSDNGRVNGSPLSQGTGAGITGMRERAEALGGTMEAGPQPGGGWRVTAVLPR
jgi:signal transduction histidine kinase